ncbi:MAG: galactose-phosphate uridylyltransferase, family 2 [Clostridiaceae bacterium]|jgi:UDPglucose--hexose-1-phosphate uridylyltransferase|uniref:UDP-glucose--hexose-1-phosphate uridylyltransferase n=1 Tax=Clostridium arbusti TaxID=1137848 RepID=UPI00028940B1|nr:UDP-glucose--hexose-1-phosphate uridylyltransferase [Clostridium arbusti]MDF2884340.1 galactose-phosphate uridylyltransferase, family 2 [Clostridiaceae bacterium]
MNIYQVIQKLINKEIDLNLIDKEDEIYVRNKIIDLLGINDFILKESVKGEDYSIPDLLEEIIGYACEHKIIEDLFYEKEILSSKIMDCFMSKPSTINKIFYEKFKDNPEVATNYFYELSKNNNYIQTKQIARNINYKAATEYGDLDITINLSKPEKNPKDIAREKLVKSTNYPKCLLCIENEGYAGKAGHPARSNHRMIRLNLLDEKWNFQYSPYAYYNEHCIVLSSEHRDMKVDRNTFSRLLEFVKQFPHYFAGSNADLPIVGGSILSHDHYQGGRYEFAMAKAEEEYKFKLNKFPNISFGIVKWPMSVIRIKAENTAAMIEAADYILNEWRKYSDPSVGIYAYTENVPHNTVTPIARKRNGIFELDIVLRNNRTSKEHPLGIFHPHEDVQHIKKENIGLIEVMGLAVLPARLKIELKEVEKYLLNIDNNISQNHITWAESLKEKYEDKINEDNVQEIVRKETAAKFLRVLEDAGVFKRNQEGLDAFKCFINRIS